MQSVGTDLSKRNYTRLIKPSPTVEQVAPASRVFNCDDQTACSRHDLNNWM